MAYNKRNWKARQGTGLNFFSIDGATPVPIVNQPTTLTEAGDALSAGNLNDWEQRIADGFDSASGELADAVEELESEDTALRSAINANSNRIANLEQKAGDYSIVQYRGTNAVPTGKAKYGLVKAIVGKTRAWNQLVNTLITGTSVVGGVTVNVESTSFTINSGTGSSSESLPLMAGIPITKGHKFLLFGCFAQLYVNNQWYENYGDTYASTWDSGGVYTAGETGEIRIQCYIRSGITYTTKKYVPKLYDLTIIFGAGNEPSTVAEALAQLPALGQDNAYDAGSLVDTVVSGVKSVGVNIWGEEWESGIYDRNTGVKDNAGGYIRSKNFIPCKPSQDYYVISGGNNINILTYDINKNLVNGYKYGGTGGLFTTEASVYYMTFFRTSASYTNDIQISEVHGSVSTVNTTYHPHMTDTLMLSAPVTPKSAGAVSEVLDVQTGKKTRPIGSEDLGTLEWIWDDDNSGCWSTTSLASTIKKPASNTVIGDMSCALYAIVPNDDTYSHLSVGISVATTGRIRVYDPNLNSSSNLSTLFNGKILNYALATPDTDQQVCDPIIDNTIYTEGGGTIETIQTQSPVIDNCLDVGYLAV